MTIEIVPCFISEAKEFIGNFHRHNKPPSGGLFAVGAEYEGNLIGVGIVGRPIARMLQNGFTVEVTRCCVVDGGPKGACSAIYGALWRGAKALGWRRLITYTLQSESGASLRGAGWKIIAERKTKDPGGWQNRPGRQWQSVVGQSKFLWEAM